MVVIIEREGGKENKKRGEGMEHMGNKINALPDGFTVLPLH